MIKILEIVSYTIPLYGNRHSSPYGKLRVSDSADTKIVEIKEEAYQQYFTYKRKRYYIDNVGSLYSPRFVIK